MKTLYNQLQLNLTFHLITSAVLTLLAVLVASGCTKDDDGLTSEASEEMPVNAFPILNESTMKSAKFVTELNAHGGLEDLVVIQGDILYDRSRWDQMKNNSLSGRQYRFDEVLPAERRTIRVDAVRDVSWRDWSGVYPGLNELQQQGLEFAIFNLNIALTDIEFEINWINKVIDVDRPGNILLYRAKQPSDRPDVLGGAFAPIFYRETGAIEPGREVRLYENAGLGNSPSDRNYFEHIFTHELCHSIGLAHSDWWNVSLSCGGPNRQDYPSDGATLIPGTVPLDRESIMNTCTPNDTDGEFSGKDRVALNYLFN